MNFNRIVRFTASKNEYSSRKVESQIYWLDIKISKYLNAWKMDNSQQDAR